MGQNEIEKSLSFYLFSKPSLIEGLGRSLDIGGTTDNYNEHRTGEEADYKALISDWLMVGKDISNSTEVYEQRFSNNTKI